MARIRVLDLDGSLADQSALMELAGIDRVDGRGWGRQIRLACTFGEFNRFKRWLGETLPHDVGSTVTFYGSGDFHHVTLALLRRIRGPFNLLVLDKHPDWMRAVPILHCGTWLRHALRLPGLRRVFHCGGLADFDNAYRWLAPWTEIRSGRVVVFPPSKSWTRGRWARIPSHPLRVEEGSVADTVRSALAAFSAELCSVPLYISVDKDVLSDDDAAVNWDSGLLRLAQALEILHVFVDAAGGHLAGADVLGDWSPVQLGTRLNRFCHQLDHPSPTHDPAQAAALNQRANLAILNSLGRTAATND